MAVVSSIRYEQITNEYNEGANYLRRFLQYAELISLGRMSAARTILDGLVPQKASGAGVTGPTVMRAQLKGQLEALGYEVAEQVGQSDFKCSLAVRRKAEDEDYALAILIDDELHYRNRNLVEQYYQRPAILKAFGWKVLAVYAKDWLHQPQKVMEQVLKALDAGVAVRTGSAAGAMDGPVAAAGGQAGATGWPVAEQAVESAGQGAGNNGSGLYDHLVFRRLVSGETGVEKFWEAATDGNKLVTRWGKAGARAQTQLKTFPDEEAARKEQERQEKEQLMKGFRPV
jgi:predicted DNA-binding WGR domain protein